MNAPSVDIADMIVADSSIALTLGTNLFIGIEPTNPDNVVTITDGPGWSPQLTYTKGENYYYPTVQIRVRNRDYRTAYELAQDIMVLLHGRSHETWNGTYYSVIKALGEPALLSWDDNRLVRFVINFDIQRR